MKATPANIHIASCHENPPRLTSKIQISGVSPPMKRADIQIIDLAKPRCEAGNQL